MVLNCGHPQVVSDINRNDVVLPSVRSSWVKFHDGFPGPHVWEKTTGKDGKTMGPQLEAHRVAGGR